MMARKKVLSSTVLSILFLSIAIPPAVQAQLPKLSTEMGISPSTFTLSSGDSITLTATLTSGGVPLVGKPITFAATLGVILPSGITDSMGQVSVTYTAPVVGVQTSVTVTASFAGDIGYEASSASSSGTIEVGVIRKSTSLALSPSSFTISPENSITITATLTSDGTPLAGKTISFSTTVGSVSPNAGTSNSEGKVSVTYTAPRVSVRTSTTVVAAFAGDTEYQASSANASGTIEVEPVLPAVTAIVTVGAAFSIPETIEDDVTDFAVTIPQEIRNLLPIPIPTTGFLLANRENLSLVLSQQSDTGQASVEGWAISPKITLGGFELSVIVAKSVSFTKEGTTATISGILATPKLTSSSSSKSMPRGGTSPSSMTLTIAQGSSFQ